MPRLRFLRPSTGLGLEKRGIHPPIWPFIGRFYYLRLFDWLLPALISASLIFIYAFEGVFFQNVTVHFPMKFIQ